jgi:hypothetical protein
MKIDFSAIPIYCLTSETDEPGIKKQHIRSQFPRVEFVNPIIGIAKNKSGATGVMRILERGLSSQTPGNPFAPFLLIEDNVSMDREFDPVNIPDDADILYVGISNCSMNDHKIHYANYYESVPESPEVVRIKHMISTHGIMVCSPLAAAVLQRTMLEVFLTDYPWDVPLAFIQPYYKVYALKRPYVYQDSHYGGYEKQTRITLDGPDRSLPEEWVTADLCTIRMIFRN